MILTDYKLYFNTWNNLINTNKSNPTIDYELMTNYKILYGNREQVEKNHAINLPWKKTYSNQSNKNNLIVFNEQKYFYFGSKFYITLSIYLFIKIYNDINYIISLLK